ncbi:MAG: RNA polymerase sigma factor [Myxococcaceae bacterium]
MKPVLTPRSLRLVTTDDESTAAASDAELIEAVASRDVSRASRLYERLRVPVSRAVRRVAPRDLDHEDLVQQAFAEIVAAMRSRPQVRNLDAWASAIAARAVFQRVRRTRLEARFCVDAEGLLDAMRDQSALPALTAARREALARILELLGALRNQERVRVFLLHDVQGFELSEIASILDITVANAQSRLVRGRNDVHEALAARPELLASLQGEES